MTPNSSNYQKPLKDEVFIPEIISRFLKARGLLNKEDQVDFLNPLLREIRDPFLLHGMETAVKRILQALENHEKIGVYCDYDLDGSSSAAILKTGLESLGFEPVIIFQPRRLKEGYGFHESGVDEFILKGVSLIITADVGITAHNTVDYASQKNIDVILTDHHLPDSVLPKALAVINPNIKECKSGLGHLCGAGVSFYLIYALAKRLKKLNKLSTSFKLEALLDFLIIGTITDMVPLIKENRTLVKRGLAQFTKTTRPGLRAIKVKEGLLGKTMGSSDIGFKVAPKLNSLSRLDTDLRPTDILIETDREKAESLVSQAYQVNTERVETLEQGLKESLDFFSSSAPENFCYYVSETIHPGVMGLIATRLVSHYNLPALVASKLKNGQIVGSARLPKNTGLSLKQLLSECPSLNQFGGHAEAAGFELSFDKVESFQKEIGYYLKSKELEQNEWDYTQSDFDCEVFVSELNKNLIPWLNQLEPFGTDFEAPVFKLSSVELASVKKLKDKHYKMILTDSTGSTVDGIWFSPPDDHEVSIVLNADSFSGRRFNFYVTPQVNFFRNQETVQVFINEAEVI